MRRGERSLQGGRALSPACRQRAKPPTTASSSSAWPRRLESKTQLPMRRQTLRHLRVVATFVLLVLLAIAAPAAAAPEGQMTWGVHISLAPTWFDPAETQGLITPFMVMYAIHDALAKAMPGNPTAPSLAESWQMSPDGRVYDFTLRKGVKFHNGDTLTSEDVKFSFERYRGAAAKADQGPRGCRGDAGAAAGAVPAEEPLAGLHDVLHGGQRRGLDRAEEVRREGRRRRPTRRRRSGPGPTSSSPSRPASSWSWRPSRATGARRRA